MAGSTSGPARKPRLQSVKEGNPGHRPLPPDLHLPPGRPEEPDWDERFPINGDVTIVAVEAARCRKIAAMRWSQWVETLDNVGQLSGNVDQAALEEACVLAAIVDRCDRIVAQSEVIPDGTNRAITAANAYRTQLYRIMAMCGLAPSARSWMKPREAQTDANPVWDA